ncbi:MAG TPA: bifunctional hydroxymethylpyrimidine kinase/phosphomethylpyrimidine kinase [Desulfatiglandales bacterium]|nr:bifunctional hydroxymethylpyrimidine kinase/phosphomethylpyrimidine kinase [Desulfatiglandales bacterium]
MISVLTIAGSDSCGGAGIQADIKTISRLGAHALTAVTAITAQNSMGIVEIHDIPAEIVSLQISTIVEDMFPGAVKIGMLHTGPIVREVAVAIRKHKLGRVVVDPVLKASSGVQLLEDPAVNLLKEALFPLAVVVTPNLYEAGRLTGSEVVNLGDMERAARQIKDLGPDVVITGGHLEADCIDVLYDGKEIHFFQGTKIETINTHGSGCVFSASLATFLAMDYDIVEATRLAHDFTRESIVNSYPCGHGPGVVHPGHKRESGDRGFK